MPADQTGSVPRSNIMRSGPMVTSTRPGTTAQCAAARAVISLSSVSDTKYWKPQLRQVAMCMSSAFSITMSDEPQD